jgi:hypothetical protein
MSAPISANSGEYGEREPSSSSSGPSRDPTKAPAANPASARPPAIRPWPKPHTAMRTVKAMMIQSRPVKARGRLVLAATIERGSRP